MVNAEDVFDSQSFESIKLIVSFKNLTTGWSPPQDDFQSLIIEIGDKTLTLELPLKSCNVGHNALVAVGSQVPGEKKPKEILSATAKIAEVENLDDSTRAVVNLMQYDEISWNAFLKLFSGRQEEISEFLRQTKF